jgi:predicted DNA-binding protein
MEKTIKKRGPKPGSGKLKRIIYTRFKPELIERLLRITDQKTISKAIRKAIEVYVENYEVQKLYSDSKIDP